MEVTPKAGESVGTAASRFAEELRAWRQRHGWSQAELGTKLGYSGSHVSSVETMTRIPVAEFAAKCDEVFQTPGTFARIHEDITKEAYPPWFSPFVHFEQMATRVHNWDARFFTGLLQTEDYARALIRAVHPEALGADVERDVIARLERQRIFDREHPPSCWFVIGEAAFRATFGGAGVMRGQVDRIAEMAALPYVTVQVYPFSAPDCPGVDGPVTVFDFERQPSTGYAEGYEAGRTIEAQREVAKLVAMFDYLRAGALSPRDSVSWIAAYRRELYGEA